MIIFETEHKQELLQFIDLHTLLWIALHINGVQNKFVFLVRQKCDNVQILWEDPKK